MYFLHKTRYCMLRKDDKQTVLLRCICRRGVL